MAVTDELASMNAALYEIRQAIDSNTTALREIAEMLRVEDHDALDMIEHDPLVDPTRQCTIATALVKALMRLSR
jgi:hypothetical protein